MEKYIIAPNMNSYNEMKQFIKEIVSIPSPNSIDIDCYAEVITKSSSYYTKPILGVFDCEIKDIDKLLEQQCQNQNLRVLIIFTINKSVIENENTNKILSELLNYEFNELFNIVDNIKDEDKDELYYAFINSKDSLSRNLFKLSIDTYADSNINNIDFTNSYFSFEKWSIRDMLNILPTDFGEVWYKSSKQKLETAAGNIEETNQGHRKELIAHWKKHKTYNLPPIIICSNDFPEAKLFGEYQLFEGHGRLAWIHYFAENLDTLKVNESHYVWVLRKHKGDKK